MDPLIYYRLYPEFRSRSWQRHSAHTRLMDYLIRKANPAQSQICGIDFPPGTILISSRQYCEQTGEHPQLFAYALRDLQYEGDIAVTLIGHTLIVTLTHYPTPAPAPEAPPSPQPATFSEPIPEATPEPAAPEETPSPQPPSSTDPVPSLSATCTARINIQHSKFPIQKESPHPLTASTARTTFKIQHSKFTPPPSPGALPHKIRPLRGTAAQTPSQAHLDIVVYSPHRNSRHPHSPLLPGNGLAGEGIFRKFAEKPISNSQ